MLKGEEIVCIEKSFQNFTFGETYEIEDWTFIHFSVVDNKGDIQVFDRSNFNLFFKSMYQLKNNIELGDESELEAPKHYNNTHGSLYDFAWKHSLNAWEFDIVKRLVRCRKKGNFKEDLEKTKFLIDLYLKEWKES